MALEASAASRHIVSASISKAPVQMASETGSESFQPPIDDPVSQITEPIGSVQTSAAARHRRQREWRRANINEPIGPAVGQPYRHGAQQTKETSTGTAARSQANQ